MLGRMTCPCLVPRHAPARAQPVVPARHPGGATCEPEVVQEEEEEEQEEEQEEKELAGRLHPPMEAADAQPSGITPRLEIKSPRRSYAVKC